MIPDYGMEPTDPVGVNPAYLADLVKVAKACEIPGVSLTNVKGALDPIGFTARGRNGHTARVAIMPMRV